MATLGIAPALGRGFIDGEDRPGHNHVAIISRAFWQRRLGGRPDVIGQPLTLDGTSYAIVGVMPAEVFFPGDLEIAIPLAGEPGALELTGEAARRFARPGAAARAADILEELGG